MQFKKIFRNFLLIAGMVTAMSYSGIAEQTEVIITDKHDHYQIYEADLLFQAIKVNEYMYVSCEALNVRKIPSIESNRWNVIFKNTKVKVVAKSQNWDIIKIGSDKFFVWNQYLTDVIPAEIIEINELTKEEKIEIPQTVPIVEAASPVVEQHVSVSAPQPPPPPPLLGNYRITFYSAEQMGNSGSANGFGSIPWVTCAAGYDIPFGTHIYIEGLGQFEVRDRGVPSGCIDIFVTYNYEIPQWGLAYLPTYLLYWGDGRTAWGYE